MPDAAEPHPDLAHADVGIVHATAMELAPFVDRCERVRKYVGGDLVFRGGLFKNIRIALAQSGMGTKPARRATQALIDGHSPGWIISAGFAGALEPGMKVGDIVVANAIVDTAGTELAIDLKMPANPAAGLYVGRIVTVERMIAAVTEKKELAARHAAVAVDMESLAIAQVCRDAKVRFLAVRVISDDLSADLPPEIASVVGSSGTVRLGAAFGAIWKRPGSVKDMWRLREQGMGAADRLATFLEGVVEQLYESRPAK
ncbi:MAG TPA: 5'-methylthioadenosine nucleosidase [Planctomycetaceae bacterium]|nr:5'-methylthioadenosine nucleosidase [Planctomycetaceae bacterium]